MITFANFHAHRKLISSTEEKGVSNRLGAGKSFKLNRGGLVIKCPNKA